MAFLRRLAVLAALVSFPAGMLAQTAAKAPGPVRYVLAPEGNEARYRVREQLASIDFPSDAVGRTTAFTGQLTFAADGSLLKDSSRFTVSLNAIASDRPNRDRYVQRNSLQTEQFPDAVLVLTGLAGLPKPLPTKGQATFQLIGEFTVHGVTRPTTWNVTADFSGGEIAGTATTAFTFTDFGIPVPTVRMVLSVKDTIRVEYDFRLVRGG
ncbi:MAG: YceI family protein [Gemmatimonadetes bacterium]|nr:YceI family protein [Gemmatimonadota bacterium]